MSPASPLTAGTKVLIMYGSANRDDRRFDNPDAFDIRRNARTRPSGAASTSAWGCISPGSRPTRFNARRVSRFELTGEPRWAVNNTLHGLATCR